MSSSLEFDIVIRKAKEMRNRSFAGNFPDQARLWKDLLSNEMVNYLPVGIAMLDRNFVLMQCNQLYQNYIDMYSYYSAGEALGMDYFEIFTSARPVLMNILKSVRDDVRQHTDNEIPLPLDKRKFPTLITYWDGKVIPIKDDAEHVVGLIISTTDVTDLVLKNNQVSLQQAEINELKSALRTVMRLRQEDQVSLEQKTLANIKHIIDPFLVNLKNRNLSPDLISSLDGIEFGINQFVSDFSQLFRNEQYCLTPKEIQVAVMIKMGKTTKEIAECFHVSPSSIDFHRKNIRSKLHLNNKRVNLQSYLASFLES